MVFIIYGNPDPMSAFKLFYPYSPATLEEEEEQLEFIDEHWYKAKGAYRDQWIGLRTEVLKESEEFEDEADYYVMPEKCL